LGTKAGSFFQLQFQISSGKKRLPEAFEALIPEWVDTMGLNATIGVLFAQLTIYEFAEVSRKFFHKQISSTVSALLLIKRLSPFDTSEYL